MPRSSIARPGPRSKTRADGTSASTATGACPADGPARAITNAAGSIEEWQRHGTRRRADGERSYISRGASFYRDEKRWPLDYVTRKHVPNCALVARRHTVRVCLRSFPLSPLSINLTAPI